MVVIVAINRYIPMNYITSLEMANKPGKTKRWINECCAKGLVKGARKEGNRCKIPELIVHGTITMEPYDINNVDEYAYK